MAGHGMLAYRAAAVWEHIDYPEERWERGPAGCSWQPHQADGIGCVGIPGVVDQFDLRPVGHDVE